MQVTTGALGQETVKQGRFICELCNLHFYHATALVSHYEKGHEKMLRGCLYNLQMCAYIDFTQRLTLNHSQTGLHFCHGKRKRKN